VVKLFDLKQFGPGIDFLMANPEDQVNPSAGIGGFSEK
jgi:hypothetical protein